MKHQLTDNFEAWITQDGGYFVIHDIVNNSADGGYALGEYATFEDAGVTYKATIIQGDKVDLQKT